MSTSPDGLGRTPAELPEFHLPEPAATIGAPTVAAGPPTPAQIPPRTTALLGALGIALVTAGTLLPNLAVELDGKEMSHGLASGLGSLIGMLSRSALSDGFIYGLGVFALIGLLVAAVASTGRVNTTVRLAAAGVATYVLGSMVTLYLSLEQQLGPGQAEFDDVVRRNTSAPELVAKPGAYCAVLGIVLLAAAVAVTGPRPAFLARIGRVTEPVELEEDGRDIEVTVG
ncbi:hypothetical protein Lfu02_29420 [Longispora fulva]|uniref:Uncharacterized protein n=1 Tax=Longispora fulva TaxID=619741 RepID=A0A8J7KS03_9ACTN|nr:hypothetical protein [Longispora fulva]MBG6139077.1 hypothetical protein [Longispora fulva]GIG58570.1 hypothetical protein Lfu02_29420 [Longispora fulva]